MVVPKIVTLQIIQYFLNAPQLTFHLKLLLPYLFNLPTVYYQLLADLFVKIFQLILKNYGV